jgi:hypothetical protein
MKTGAIKYLIILNLFFIGSYLYGQSQNVRRVVEQFGKAQDRYFVLEDRMKELTNADKIDEALYIFGQCWAYNAWAALTTKYIADSINPSEDPILWRRMMNLSENLHKDAEESDRVYSMLLVTDINRAKIILNGYTNAFKVLRDGGWNF